MAHVTPPWAVTNAAGQRMLSISVQTADGAALEVVPRASAFGEVLLTTSAHSATRLVLPLLLGARAAASACRLLGRLELPLPPDARGLPQVLLQVRLEADALLARARDVQTGRTECWVLEARAAEATTSEAGRYETPSEGRAAEAADAAALPSAWRFETAYTEVAHRGLCCAGGRFLRVPCEADEAAAGVRRLGADGEVAPESTASRVWPGAHLLASGLHEPCVTRRLGGATVVELGAGVGLPGLAAWTLGGGAQVVLTDLDENLPRLRRAVSVNGAEAAVRVEPLDWTRPLPSWCGERRWDVVLAADCVFWAGLIAPLLATLDALSRAGRTHDKGETPDASEVDSEAPPPCLILLTVTSRLDRAARFEEAARAEGWSVAEVKTAVALPSTHTRLLRLTRGEE